MAPKKHSKKRSQKREKSGRKKKVHVVPGYTRVGGPYARSLPCGPEKKFLDTRINLAVLGALGTATDATAAFTPGFLAIARGTGDTERVGNLICVKNFNFRGHLFYELVNANQSARVRVIFFWDLQANGAVPTIADLLEGPVADASNNVRKEIDGFRNLDNVARFKIIKDKTYTYNATSLVTGPYSTAISLPVKVSWKGDMPVHYSSNTGAITEMRSENLSFVVFSDTGDAGALVGPNFNPVSGWNLNGVGRVKYTDL